MATAAQHVLALPELLSTILQFVHADECLINCMLVNSLWQHEATTIQWADVGQLRLAIVHPERHQYYASKVRQFSIALEHTIGSMLSLVNDRALVFPRLTRIKLYTTANSNMDLCKAMLDPVLPPSLQSVDISLLNSDGIASLLNAIAGRCNQLKEFKLAWADYWPYALEPPMNTPESTMPALLVVFNSLPSLKHIDLTDMGYLTPSENLSKMLTFPKVQSVSLKIRSSLSQWKEFERGFQPGQFDNLRSFTIQSSFPIVFRLCHVLPATLTSLDIECIGGVEGVESQRQGLTNHFFNAITRFSELHTLRISSTEAYDYDADPWGYPTRRSKAMLLTAFILNRVAAQLPHLRILHFSGSILDVDVTDSDIERLAQSLTRLSSFIFSVEGVPPDHRSGNPGRRSKLSTASLVALGTHCRALQELKLYGAVDLRALDDYKERWLFPNLKTLSLSLSWSFRPAEGLSPIIPFLEFHCPRLQAIGRNKPPWDLATIFSDNGPTYLNGFNLIEIEPEGDEYSFYPGGMPMEQATWFDQMEEDDEPSIWGNELFERDEAGSDWESDESNSESEFGSDRSADGSENSN